VSGAAEFADAADDEGSPPVEQLVTAAVSTTAAASPLIFTEARIGCLLFATACLL
jgi:hypothetical protein